VKEEQIREALRRGLYRNREELLADLVSDRDDDFNRLAQEHSLASQIKADAYGKLLDSKGAVWGPRVDNVKLDFVVVVNGPGRLGTVIGTRGKTAEFKIQMRGTQWVKFLGKSMGRHTPHRVLAHALGCSPKALAKSVERVVRKVGVVDGWVTIDRFPVDVSTIQDEKVAAALAETKYGIQTSKGIELP